MKQNIRQYCFVIRWPRLSFDSRRVQDPTAVCSREMNRRWFEVGIEYVLGSNMFSRKILQKYSNVDVLWQSMALE